MSKEKIMKLIKQAKNMFEDEKGESGVKLIIGVFLIAILAGALIPAGVQALVTGRNTSWNASTLSSYDSIQILIIVAVIAGVAGLAYKSIEG